MLPHERSHGDGIVVPFSEQAGDDAHFVSVLTVLIGLPFSFDPLNRNLHPDDCRQELFREFLRRISDFPGEGLRCFMRIGQMP